MGGMPEYGRFCPVSLTTEVLADRWTPLIVRELVLGNTRFNDIARGLPGISRSLLTQRLRHLEKRGVVERWPAATGQGRSTTSPRPAGPRADHRRLRPLGDRVALRRPLPARGAPAHADVVDAPAHGPDASSRPAHAWSEFVFTAPDPMTVWLVLEHGEVSVCHQHPGFDSDVVLRGTTGDVSDVFNGAATWPQAVRSGAIEVLGPTAAGPRAAVLVPVEPVGRGDPGAAGPGLTTLPGWTARRWWSWSAAPTSTSRRAPPPRW